MRRATVTLPADLEDQLESWLATQDPRPSLAGVVQSALRFFLENQKLHRREYRPPSHSLTISAAASGSGAEDVSLDHDRHLAEIG